MAMLDKQLIAIQEHHIDMQDHLIELEGIKNGPKPKSSLPKKLLDLLK